MLNRRSQWLVALIVAIPSAAFGLGYYFAGRDFALALSSLVASIIVVVNGVASQGTETKERLREHSQTLIKEARETWFIERDIYHAYSEMPFKLVFFVAEYGTHGRSEIKDRLPEHVLQVEAHLKSGYPSPEGDYLEATRVAKAHLQKVIKLWEQIEEVVSKKVGELCPRVKEWDSSRNIRPMDTFDLKRTVNLLYLDILFVVNHEKPFGYFKAPRETTSGPFHYYDVGEGAFQSTALEDASNFTYLMNEMIQDTNLQELVRTQEKDKAIVYEKIDPLKRGFEQIEDDFTHGFQILKGTCPRCIQIRRSG